MIIPVNEKYRISTDAHCWKIDKFRVSKGEERWESFKYYGSLEQAVNGLADLMIRASDAETLADAIRDIEAVSHTLCLALTPEYKVTKNEDHEPIRLS